MVILAWLVLAYRTALLVGSDAFWVLLSGSVLFVALARPRWRTSGSIEGAALLFLLGLSGDSFLLMGLAVTLMAQRSLATIDDRRTWFGLLFLSSPWLTTDLAELGWFFRVSAAWVTTHCLNLVGLEVHRTGTEIWMSDFVLMVEPACSGLNFLQAWMLAALTSMLLSKRSKSVSVGRVILQIVSLVWLANTVRVLLLAVGGHTLGVEALRGSPHLWLGWLLFLGFFWLWSRKESV